MAESQTTLQKRSACKVCAEFLPFPPKLLLKAGKTANS